MNGKPIIFIYLHSKQKSVLNDETENGMGANVKNTNILAGKFGKMKYFATLSLSLSLSLSHHTAPI